jgi:hypothetical protein
VYEVEVNPLAPLFFGWTISLRKIPGGTGGTSAGPKTTSPTRAKIFMNMSMIVYKLPLIFGLKYAVIEKA